VAVAVAEALLQPPYLTTWAVVAEAQEELSLLQL
jgi:hypothetical protein